MEFKRNKVATALACVMGASAAVTLTNAFAQAVNPDVPSLTRQPADIRVDVTGSNIKRIEGEGSLPVQVITREEIDKSGATTAMELLQQISANNSLGAVSIASSVGATTLSAQTASLRGLGGGRTLVLINGHRLEGFSGEIQGVQGVNLAAIPFAALDRVEILKDGASAVYGSDAIGGVINFITRNDYNGAEVTGFYGTPTRGGGGDQWTGTASVGFGDLNKNGWNAFLSGSYNEQKSLDQADRNFSNSSYIPAIGLIGVSSNTNPGRVTTGGIGTIFNGQRANDTGNCGPNLIFANDDILGTNCFFDPSAVHGINMIPNDKLYNFFGNANFKINNDWTAYVQGLYSKDETHLIIQPGPVSNLFVFGPDDTPATITLQPTSAFYPHDIAAAAGVDGKPLNIRYRTFDNGFRDQTDTNEHWNFVAGAKGSWANWDWDGSAFYAEGKTTQHLNDGFQDYRILMPILNSGVVNFFGPNTPDVVNLERSANFVGDAITGRSKNYGAQIKTSGEVYKLPAGPLAVAFGLETRKEELTQNMAEALQGGYITGYGGQIKNVEGSRKQWAAFTEVNIPIVKTLEGNVAVRYDHYSDFGSTTNPKFSLRWQPMREVLLRGSYGTGFLAPSLYQLFTPNITGVSQPGLSDPIRCPVTGDTGFDCNTQFGVLFGGNRALKPEESEQATFGIVWEPIPNASISLDYFKINLKNAIVNGISPLTILGDLDQFGNQITRAPADPGSNLPGRILSILQTYINLGAERIQGVDVEGHFRAPTQPWGRLSFNLQGTYYLRYDGQNPDGSFSGAVGNTFATVVTGVIPRRKHYVSATWDQGPWSATLAQTFQTSYTDQQTDIDGNNRTVGSMSIWDIQGSYSGYKNWKLALGVKNLFDRDPPKSNQQSTFIVGFDPTYYDPRGRFVYGTVTYTFK
jgi:iron complex outermembrane receptor protein